MAYIIKWHGERAGLVMLGIPHATRSRNPGYCFQKAGWRRCGVTKGGLLIFEKVMQ